MIKIQKSRIILASGSTIRRQILTQAGLVCDVFPASIEEGLFHENLKKALEKVQSQKEIAKHISHMALTLAEEKARNISHKMAEKEAFIIAADQILAVNGKIFTKPRSIDEARAHLRFLRGREHCLYNAITLWRNDVSLWHYLDSPKLVMRNFSDEFLEYYLAQEGESLCHCVGAYRLEGTGIHLFSAQKGDDKSVFGLPLLPLLAALREKGCLSE